jgi:short-subunit dehydrogenase
MKNLNGKVAAITGAASGIGRELTLELARRGCHVAICTDRNVEGLQETADEAQAIGVNVTSQKVDVADRAAVYDWAEQVAKDHGKVNLIINNAGVGLNSTIEGMSIEDFEWLMSINFWGVVYGTKAFLPHLKAAGEGHIVNVSSALGLMSLPCQGAYNSAKFALRGFTDCLRQELDIMNCGVSATIAYPGGIKTPFVSSGRMNNNVRSLGFDERDFQEKFEKAFITEADKTARSIIHGVEKNKRRTLIGPDAHLYDGITRLLPGAYQLLTVALTKFFTR